LELALDTARLPQLLEDEDSAELMEKYFDTTKQNMQTWTQNSLHRDGLDWKREVEPETDVDGYYRTSLPVIFFQMIQQTIQVAETISDELKRKVYEVCVVEMNKFAGAYKEAIREYKEEHFLDREQPPYYPLYMVAVINNCEAFCELSHKFQREMDGEKSGMDDSVAALLQLDLDSSMPEPAVMADDNATPLSRFKYEMDQVAYTACGFLLEEIFLDLKDHFNALFQRPWLNDLNALATILVTVEDYYSDYVHLRPRYFSWIMKEAERRITVEYLKSILGRKMKLNSPEERSKAGEKLLEEQQMLASLFNKLSAANTQFRSCDVLIPIAEVLKLQDKSMMALELSGLVSKYADATAEQLQAMLAVRGDFSTSEAKELTEGLVGEMPPSSSDQFQEKLFKDVDVDMSSMNNPFLRFNK